MRYLLDTNTCIAAMRNHTVVIQHFKSLPPSDCAVSTISAYELFTGVEKCANSAQEQTKVNLFLSNINVLAFDLDAGKEAARIRAVLEAAGFPIGPYDVLLAGHAVALSLILVTANVKEFSRVQGLPLENWEI